MELNWTKFKAILDSKGLSPQEIDTPAWGYILSAFDGPQTYTCTIDEDDNTGADKTDYETNYQPKANRSIILPALPFAAKTLPDGSKLYERKHGVAGGEVAAGQSETTIFSVPYPTCKITAVQVVGSKLGDQVDFRILDTPAGTVSTVPNYPLNQFGFGVYVTDGEFKEESRYDADLFLGLQLEMTYTNNGSSPVTPNYNVLLHELK